MDFGALPPEINSAKMYAGAGSGPLMAAAAAWDGLATELQSATASYGSTVSGLTNEWSGPSSASMSAAAAPYVAWMANTAAQAEQVASQAKAAAAAYETAFMATVPPPVVAANRSLLMSLIATNILGQNTPAIAGTEAHYGEMWAQDAAAMYGYAGASAAATTLTPFTPAEQSTTPGGQAGQAAAVAQATGTSAATTTQSVLSQLTSAVPSALQSLASTGSSSTAAAAAPSGLAGGLSSLATLLENLTGPFSPFVATDFGGVFYLLGVQSFYLIPQNGANVAGLLAGSASKALVPASFLPSTAGLTSATEGLGGAGSAASAGMGHASLVGGLSVPRSWAGAAPMIRPAAMVLEGTGLGAAPAVEAASSGSLFSEMGLAGLAGRAVSGTAFRSVAVAGAARGGAGAAARGRAGATGPEDAPTTATIIVIPAAEN